MRSTHCYPLISWLLTSLSIGCASGLLVSEGEELLERGELQEAISRYDEALLKRPAWPQGVEDESEALSELRERLTLKLNERVITALEELRWEDACQVATEAEYLDGVSPAQARVALLSPVLMELQRQYDEHLMEIEGWGELPWLLKGLERCEASPSLIEELLARFAVVVTISVEERASQLSAHWGSIEAERRIWEELNRLELRSSSLSSRLPLAITRAWREQLSELRAQSARVSLERAIADERFGLAWAYASLSGSQEEAELLAALTRQRTLFEVIAPPRDPLLSLQVSDMTPHVRVARADELRALKEGGRTLSDARLWLSLQEEAPSCARQQEEVTGEVRSIDHYEERPDPVWLKAIVQVEEAQTHYEARTANLAQLKERLSEERDPLVQGRLQREVDRSSVEVKEAEERLSLLEREAELLPKVTRTPIYVVFRYPVTEWTLECSLTWRLTLREDRVLSPSAEELREEPEQFTWSTRVSSKDKASRAYPQHQVKPDPLRFPEPEAALRARGRQELMTQLQSLLRERRAAARQALYEQSQRPTMDLELEAERLDLLATLSLTSEDAKELTLLLELLTFALARDPRWESATQSLSSDELSLGLRGALEDINQAGASAQ